MRERYNPASFDDRQERLPDLPGDFPFMCGNCGERFASKADKRRHKAECAPKAVEGEQNADEPPCEHEHLYARSHVTPAIKARADAEWAAMDWRGRLPEGWSYGDAA